MKLRIFLALSALLALSASQALAVISQKGEVRVAVEGKLSPRALPRQGAAPIAVSVSGQVSTTDASLPPQLRRLRIEINRNGRLDTSGLPSCAYNEVQPATDQRALAACRDALVGQGTFDAYIVLKGSAPYPTKGRLLLFNGQSHDLLGHIYISKPFASSFVIPFAIKKSGHGRYGTVLDADLAKALGDRRYLTGIQMTLQRRYSAGGERRSFLSAGCPAPKGFARAVFPMVRASFQFAGGSDFALSVDGECRVG
jgi:hypothetical protein